MPSGNLSNEDYTVANRIAEVTGESVSKYSAEEYEIPDYDDLEVLDADEYYGEDE